MWLVVIETLFDEFCVFVIAGEQNRFRQAVTAFDFVAVFHQVLKHFVDRVLVENPAVDGRGVDPVWKRVRFHIIAPVSALPLLLLLIAERVVVDALAGELQSTCWTRGGTRKPSATAVSSS